MLEPGRKVDQRGISLDHRHVKTWSLLWLYESVLRCDGEAVGRPGQLKAQPPARVVTDVNVPRGGRNICKKKQIPSIH
jgi:hypothetical protein